MFKYLKKKNILYGFRIMGMVTSSQMAAPLLTTECVTSEEASVRASADEPGTGSVRGLYGFYLDVCSNSNAAGFKQNFCESNDLSPYLSPNSQMVKLVSGPTQYSFSLQ